MQLRGFYNGKIDGIWSDKTIAAKKKWENDRSFAPALPNNGLPFGDRGPYPKGVWIEPKTKLLSCVEVEDFLNKPQDPSTPPQQQKKEASAPAGVPATETPAA